MLRFPWLRGSRSARGTPPMRRALRGHPFLLPILSLVLLSQAGCQSGFLGPCSSCSTCNDGPIRTWFRQRGWGLNGSSPMFGGAVSSGVPVIEGAPAVVAPAPLGSPGSGLPPATEVSPSLEPIPSATPGPTPSSGSSSTSGSGGSSSGGSQGARAPNGATGKLNYEAARPRFWFDRGSGGRNAQRTYAQRTPSPTYRSAQGVAVASGTTDTAAKSSDVRPTELSMLDNLPPLDLPRDQQARTDVKTAAASAADRDRAPSALPGPVEATANVTAEATTPPLPTEVSVAPGLKRFAVVEPKLAGGSLPSTDGLDWLSEKGYRTLVDLREPGDVQSTFLAEVSRRGLRYISLPVSLTTVDRDHLARFGFEVSLADARPLYFFDADGKRAGMLWYLHRMTDKNESYDPEDASHQAEELGFGEGPFKKAAQAYLEGLKKTAPPAQTPAPAPANAPEQDPTAPSTTRPAAKAAAAPAPGPVPGASSVLPDQATIPEKPEALVLPDAATLNLARATDANISTAPARPDGSSAGDPNAWRPYLALVLAALGLPVAYCGRSIIQFRGLIRASLPKPRRPLRSLPAASGE